MDRPFREVHELYRILYLRAEAQQKAEEERKKKEEEERKKKSSKSGGRPNNFVQKPPSDAPNSTIPEPSPLEIEALEDALEEIL